LRKKNVKRAAKALFESQGDDKNANLAARIYDREIREIVKDQGRALLILEKLVLPLDQEDFSQEEMEYRLTKKLLKKGHKLQDDEVEDTELEAAKKQEAMQRRFARVGKTWVKPEAEPTQPEFAFPQEVGEVDNNVTREPWYKRLWKYFIKTAP